MIPNQLDGWMVGDMCGTGDMDGVAHMDEGSGGGYGRGQGIWMGDMVYFLKWGGASFKMRGILYPFPATLSDLQMFSLII